MARVDPFVAAMEAAQMIRLHKEIPDVDALVDELVAKIEEMRSKASPVNQDEVLVPEDRQSRLADYPHRRRDPESDEQDPFENRFQRAARPSVSRDDVARELSEIVSRHFGDRE